VAAVVKHIVIAKSESVLFIMRVEAEITIAEIAG
jgi:hypothetical protein